VAAALFSVGMFASFSIATVLGPLVHLCRQSVFHTFLPSLSRLQAAGDIPGMLKLNSRASVMVGALVYPLLAFAFVFAEEIVTIIYTAAYVDAAPVMRVFIVGFAGLVVDLGSTMLVLRQGVFIMRVSLLTLALSVALSWFSAHAFGLAGAAVGSVTAIYVDYIVILRRLALCTGIPVRQLKDWRTLGLLILFAAVAAAIAWSIVDLYFSASGPLARVIVGGTLVAAVYAAMAASIGIGRGWLAAVRNSERGS
jgi:O-antigen/teichoic acid export membrane protein